MSPDGVRLFGRSSRSTGWQRKDASGRDDRGGEDDGQSSRRTTIVEANWQQRIALGSSARPRAMTSCDAATGHSRERGACAPVRRPVEITESLGGMNEEVDAARAMATRPDLLPTNFQSANRAHRRTTGPELWMRGRRRRRLVAGVVTAGRSRARGAPEEQPRLRYRRRARALRSFGAPGAHKIQGIGRLRPPVPTARYRRGLAVGARTRSRRPSGPRAGGSARRLSCGAACGPRSRSAGARVAGQGIAVVLPDSGERTSRALLRALARRTKRAIQAATLSWMLDRDPFADDRQVRRDVAAPQPATPPPRNGSAEILTSARRAGYSCTASRTACTASVCR